MNTAGHFSLDDILDAYVAENEGPSHAALAVWTQRYPQYERELAEFTAQWSLMHWLPATPVAATAEGSLVQQGMQSIKGILAHAVAARPEEEPLNSLLEEGRSRGLAVGTLAERVGLSIPLLLKLDRRLIRATTIPPQVVDGLARAVGRQTAIVATYLQGSPRLAQGASYHASEAPALVGQEDFGDAVRSDLTLSADQRSQLLALDAAAE